jgi:hypothetical protein
MKIAARETYSSPLPVKIIYRSEAGLIEECRTLMVQTQPILFELKLSLPVYRRSSFFWADHFSATPFVLKTLVKLARQRNCFCGISVALDRSKSFFSGLNA